jgi:CheY-like chemotaxis protein
MTDRTDTQPLRVLVVEDKALVALDMEQLLVEAGHAVAGIADTLEDAVRRAEAGRPELALVDVQLARGESGLEVAATLHARGITCLLATGNCPAEPRDDAVGCLCKPFTAVQLIQAVAAAYAASKGAVPGLMPAGLTLYPRGDQRQASAAQATQAP